MTAALAPNRPSEHHAERQVALKALQRIAESWGLEKRELPRLLSRPARTVRDWLTRQRRDALDPDVLERISHLVNIYDGLHRLFGDGDYADRWITEPNGAFDGRAPAELLLSGSFTSLLEVRQYVDRALQF